jgi:hypothetical protein
VVGVSGSACSQKGLSAPPMQSRVQSSRTERFYGVRTFLNMRLLWRQEPILSATTTPSRTERSNCKIPVIKSSAFLSPETENKVGTIAERC